MVGISGYGGAGKSTPGWALVQRAPGAVRLRGGDFLDIARFRRRSSDRDGVERDQLAQRCSHPSAPNSR
ncbi:hypothetical protein SAMN06264364_1316 [Quadrisphaera granulorum]|uniref:Uncharacterized protein n=1 Tax=Quadrisphaera granulorum TaxID=317664 RepID=A0A315ZSN0_9ACTN|nr:hypothetical protein BXY45_1316 [Quadrisphaera granulorum]SZE98443.1 hypothetical protein SAMN06264364_1316 [Quadrisphaera granulorum]